MEIINRNGVRWPDPDTGPFDLWTTVAIIDGRPEVVGVELWAIDPASLEKRVTHLTPAQAERHWPRLPDPAWDDRTGVIRTKDLRIPLGRVLTDYMSRQRRLAKGITTAGFARKIARTLNPDLRPDQPHPSERPKAQAAAHRILELTDQDAPSNKVGRPALSGAHYADVAAVYTDALRNGADPTDSVRQHFNVSKSNAAKWIYRCRRPPLNLLEPTVRGRPAGAADDSQDTPKPRRN